MAPKVDWSKDPLFQDSTRKLDRLEGQVDKLFDVTSRGEGEQGGYLSSKQVRMYRNMMKEIEKIHKESTTRMNALNKDFLKKEQDYMDATTSGTFTRSQLNKLHIQMKQAESKANAYKRIHSSIDSQQKQATAYGARIDALRQSDMLSNPMMGGGGYGGIASSMLGFGYYGLTSKLGLAYLINSGVDQIRQQESSGAMLGMKMQTYDSNFKQTVRDAQTTGRENGYTAQDTLGTEQAYVRNAGTSGSKENLAKDVSAMQEFGRAYGVNPNNFALQTGVLAQMGATSEGQQRKFANLLAGAIDKTHANGREEEVIASTNQLLLRVGSKMVEMTSQQAGNVVQYQSMLGEALPTMKGQRGAELLSQMDYNIKNGDNNLDILMGKGTKYVGPEGSWALGLQKEKGISDPENLKTILQNIRLHMGGSEAMKKNAIRETLGLSYTQVQSLADSGLLDKFETGFTDQDVQNLENSGQADLAKRIAEYKKSNDYKVQKNKGTVENLKSRLGSIPETITTNLMDFFGGLPMPIQEGLTVFGAMSMGKGIGKGFDLLKNLGGKVIPTIGGGSSTGTPIRSLIGKAIPKLTPLVKPGLMVGAEVGAYNSIANGSIGDWLFGHKEGQIKSSLLHPFSPERYTDTVEPGWMKWFKGESKKEEPTKEDKPQYSNFDSTKTTPNTVEHTIKVKVEGSIDGMTLENQDKVANSFENYFERYFGSYGGFDLSTESHLK